MSTKLKAMGLSLIAALAVSAVAVMNASATEGGHFTSGVAHTTLDGVDEETDKTQFTGGATVECHEATYSGTTTSSTETEVTITPTYKTCTDAGGPASVHMNGCHYIFTVRSEPEAGDSTTHLICEKGSVGPQITTSTGCTITITPNQTVGGGVVYTNNKPSAGKITVDVTASAIHATYSPAGSFACFFRSTTSTASMHGSVELQGTDTEGEAVSISAT